MERREAAKLVDELIKSARADGVLETLGAKEGNSPVTKFRRKKLIDTLDFGVRVAGKE